MPTTTAFLTPVFVIGTLILMAFAIRQALRVLG